MGGVKGNFSVESLERYQSLLQQVGLPEGETYDFARCVRPDGTFYGTKGKCMPPNKPATSGKEEGSTTIEAPKPKPLPVTKGISAESSKVLSGVLKRRNRQYDFLTDAMSD